MQWRLLVAVACGTLVVWFAAYRRLPECEGVRAYAKPEQQVAPAYIRPGHKAARAYEKSEHDGNATPGLDWLIEFNRDVPIQPWRLRGSDPCVPVLGQTVEPRGNYRYVASSLEKEWMETPHVGRICETARRQKHAAEAWLNYSKTIFVPVLGEPGRQPTASEAEVLSYFLVGDNPQKRWIEPLSGVARHPLAVCLDHEEKFLFDIQYLILDSFCGQTGPKPRTVYFDLGCTRNGEPESDFLHFDYHSGSGGGPSIPLFFNMYRDRCLEFDEIYGWEARDVNMGKWWAPLPDTIRRRTHFYNVPIKESSCPESAQGVFAPRGSFLNMLPDTVSPDDFVVVKVDIDRGPELQIVEAIARLPHLSALVDEIFFEYHFYFDGLNFGWNDQPKSRNVDTALDIMRRLREAGVRSHFWI